jgi:hypothetical protein
MTRQEQTRQQVLAEAEKFGVPGFATPTWRARYATGAFKRRQRVAVRRLLGARFDENWDEQATIIDGRPQAVSPTSGDWYAVRFDDGGSICVHETQLRAV